jgi:heterodisulfide reductase subunit C
MTVRRREFRIRRVGARMPVRIATDEGSGRAGSEIRRISGQNPFLCIQCGMCTGACPLAHRMEANPRLAVHLLQLGLMDRLGRLNTAWVCASCLDCQVVCPRGIDLPRVMEALRLISLRRNKPRLDPAELPAEALRGLPPIALVAAFRKMT